MSVSHYRTLRAKGMIRSKAMALSGVTVIDLALSAASYAVYAVVAIWIAVALSRSAMSQTQRTEEQASEAALRARVEQLEKIVVSCLNGSAIAVGNEWHGCYTQRLNLKVQP